MQTASTVTRISTVTVDKLSLPFTDKGVFTRRTLLDRDVTAYAAQFGALPETDVFGYEMAYYVGAPILSYVNDVLCVDIDDRGDVVLRSLLGECLCAACASDAPDFAYYIAYQINGEVGDADNVYCAECGRVIYKAYDPQD